VQYFIWIVRIVWTKWETIGPGDGSRRQIRFCNTIAYSRRCVNFSQVRRPLHAHMLHDRNNLLRCLRCRTRKLLKIQTCFWRSERAHLLWADNGFPALRRLLAACCLLLFGERLLLWWSILWFSCPPLPITRSIHSK
jgi:hypothetical protein